MGSAGLVDPQRPPPLTEVGIDRGAGNTRHEMGLRQVDIAGSGEIGGVNARSFGL